MCTLLSLLDKGSVKYIPPFIARQRLDKRFPPGTSLPSCYLATIGRDIDRPIDTRVQQFFYSCVYSLLQGRVYQAVA
jgi:hypothetical protein